MRLKKAGLLSVAIATLSGCIESEKSCYDKLRADFTASQAFASEQLRGTPEYMRDERQGYLDYASTASVARARLTSIYLDDDQNACDYISDGPRLKRN